MDVDRNAADAFYRMMVGLPITVFLLNRKIISGKLVSFDDESVILENLGSHQQQLLNRVGIEGVSPVASKAAPIKERRARPSP